MIARIWRGQATIDNAEAYHRHVTRTVFPALLAIPGHREAYLMRRETAGRVEFLAVTLWDSMASIKQFAGSNPALAVVEPQARAVLAGYDNFVLHYDIVHCSNGEKH